MTVRSNQPAQFVSRGLPLGTLGIHVAAGALNEALTSAVRWRAQLSSRLSCDLSGGLDSSVVAILAAGATAGAALPAVTLVPIPRSGDDIDHALRVAATTRGLRHVVAPLPASVDPFAKLSNGYATDEPFDDVSTVARLRWWFDLAASLGSGGHLTGDGGDAVLLGTPAYLADLVAATQWRELWNHCAGWALLRHRPTHRLVAGAIRLARTPQPVAVAELVNQLRTNRPDPAGHRWEDLIAWFPAHRTPTWLTPYARPLAAATIERTVCDPDAHPTEVGIGDMCTLSAVRSFGRAHRGYLQVAAGSGLDLHAPYLDDAVVRACLSAPAAQRITPRKSKPLLADAMQGVVPEHLLRRSTKGDYSKLAYRGLHQHHRSLREIFTESRLAQLGLIDEVVIRTKIEQAAAGLPVSVAALDHVLGAELWLRQHDASAARRDNEPEEYEHDCSVPAQ